MHTTFLPLLPAISLEQQQSLWLQKWKHGGIHLHYANYTNFVYNILIFDFSTPQVFKIILLEGCLQKLKIYRNVLNKYNLFPREKTDRVPGWGDDWSRNRSGLLGQTGGRDGRSGYLRLRCATLARRRWQYSVSRPASESCTLALDSVTGGRHIFIYTLSRTQDHGTGTHWATRWDSAAILFNYVGKTNDPRNAPGPGYICHVTRINTNNKKYCLQWQSMPIHWWKIITDFFNF